MKLTAMGKMVNSTAAILGGIVASLLGGFDDILVLLLSLIVTDYLTGLLVAIKQKKLSSEVGMLGIVKKVIILILIFVGYRLDVALHTSFMRNMVVFFFVSNEGISLLENTAHLGVPYPPKLKSILAQLKEGEE